MPFTEEERQRIREALKERGVPGICPVCQKGELWVSDYIAFVPVREKHAEVRGAGTIVEGLFPVGDLPCVVVVCAECGNTMLFHLSGLGLWDELVGGLEAARRGR